MSAHGEALGTAPFFPKKQRPRRSRDQTPRQVQPLRDPSRDTPFTAARLAPDIGSNWHRCQTRKNSLFIR